MTLRYDFQVLAPLLKIYGAFYRAPKGGMNPVGATKFPNDQIIRLLCWCRDYASTHFKDRFFTINRRAENKLPGQTEYLALKIYFRGRPGQR